MSNERKGIDYWNIYERIRLTQRVTRRCNLLFRDSEINRYGLKSYDQSMRVAVCKFKREFKRKYENRK